MNSKYLKIILAVCSLSLFLNCILLVIVTNSTDFTHMDSGLALVLVLLLTGLAVLFGFSGLVVFSHFYKRMGWPGLHMSPRWQIAIGVCLVTLFCLIVIPFYALTFIDVALHIPSPPIAISFFANNCTETCAFLLLIPGIVLIVIGRQQKREQQYARVQVENRSEL